MRKHSVRKWLHAILDLLPLFVIPIFAIYTRNENYNSNIEVQVYENKEVNFNQLGTKDFGNVKTDYLVDITKTNATGTAQWWGFNNGITYESGHTYYVRLRNVSGTSINNDVIQLAGSGQNQISLNNYPNGTYWTINTINDSSCGVIFHANTPQGTNIKFYFNFIDLTYMFGEGNEPSQSQMDEWYPNTYYEYTTYTKEYVPNVLTTYNDTDVGSQFVYTLYNATDKYFNCTNLFNLEQVWNWVQLNLFGGNAPLMVYVVWQVIVYEFFMDLIFLLYSVFMFIIDFAQDCLEKPFNRIRRM